MVVLKCKECENKTLIRIEEKYCISKIPERGSTISADVSNYKPIRIYQCTRCGKLELYIAERD